MPEVSPKKLPYEVDLSIMKKGRVVIVTYGRYKGCAGHIENFSCNEMGDFFVVCRIAVFERNRDTDDLGNLYESSKTSKLVEFHPSEIKVLP